MGRRLHALVLFLPVRCFIMMIMPSKEELRAYDLITPWCCVDFSRLCSVLRDDAPEEIVELAKKHAPRLLDKD